MGTVSIMSDPSARRATRLARLVILTVALPSLLLTAFGVVAVSNEEAAARRRLEHAYSPLGEKLAGRFNDWIEERLDTDGPRLAELAKWADDPLSPPPPELEEWLASARYAVNFFVIERDLGRLLPASSTIAFEAPFTALLDVGSPPGASDCARVRPLSTCGAGCEVACPTALAAALCSRAAADWSLLEARCEPYARHPAVAELRGLLQGGGLLDARELIRALERVTGALELPAHLPAPPGLVPVVARRGAALVPEDEAPHLRRRLLLLSTQEELFDTLEQRRRIFQPVNMAVEAVAVGEWRRVVVFRTLGDRLVGYELVPDAIPQALGFGPDAAHAADGMRLVFNPITAPKWWCCANQVEGKRRDDAVVWWALLKRTDLAWSIALEFVGQQSFWSLSRSRSGLYFWALVLVASALLGGIVYTLRAVAREGRLSRLKSDFVSSVSHDLRTPLTSIRMFTESLLMGRVVSPEQQRQYLEVIAEEAERLSRLTERILDFSRMEAGRRAYAFRGEEVAHLVEKALRSCAPMIEESEGKVTVDIPSDLPEVRGDHDALVELLINLVSNALKYSEGQPTITIRARPEGSWFVLDVQDRGIGISPADQKRIFEKFYRVDCRRTSEVGGCGIGLSLVQYIVESHGGEVTVSSALGRGSIFSVRLPAATRVDAPVSTAGATSGTLGS